MEIRCYLRQVNTQPAVMVEGTIADSNQGMLELLANDADKDILDLL